MFDIKVILKKTDVVLSYDYFHKMHGYVCNVLGNTFHKSMLNNYIYTNLLGGDNTKDGIVFKENPYFLIRTDDCSVLANFLNNLPNNKLLFDGLEIECFTSYPTISKKSYFRTVKSSPILVSKNYDRKDVLSKDDLNETEKYLIESIHKHAIEYGFEVDSNLSIKIIRQHNHKDIRYRNILNKGRVFELQIKCDNKTKEFILLHGIGRSVGSGFGFLI